MNKVILVGRLGRDPEMRYTPNGKAVTSFRMATNRRFKNSDGEQVEAADWHNITVWGAQAEACNTYLTKGRLVSVEGRIQYDTYEQDGQTKYFTKIIAQSVEFLDRGDSGGAAGSEEEEEIPF